MQRQSELVCKRCNMKGHTRVLQDYWISPGYKNRKKKGNGSYHQKKYNANWSIMGNPNSTMKNCMVQQKILILSDLIVEEDHNARMLTPLHMMNINKSLINSRRINACYCKFCCRFGRCRRFEAFYGSNGTKSETCNKRI